MRFRLFLGLLGIVVTTRVGDRVFGLESEFVEGFVCCFGVLWWGSRAYFCSADHATGWEAEGADCLYDVVADVLGAGEGEEFLAVDVGGEADLAPEFGEFLEIHAVELWREDCCSGFDEVGDDFEDHAIAVEVEFFAGVADEGEDSFVGGSEYGPPSVWWDQ